jgi:thioredoxin 1
VAIDAEHYLQEGQDMTLKAVTDATFNIEVLMNDKPVLVHFWATWSGPSRMNTPILQEVANQYPDTLSVVQLDVDANPVTPRTYGIMQIPTMNLYRDSEVVRQIVGTLPKTALLADLAGYI